MRKVQIIQEIDITVFKRRGAIESWRIGVTDDPAKTRHAFKQEGQDVRRWQQWRADTPLDAEAIGELFKTLGMQPAGDRDTAGETATVYVF